MPVISSSSSEPRTVKPHPFSGGERSLLYTNVQADLSLEDGCREKLAKVGNLNDRGNQFVGDGSCHNAALCPAPSLCNASRDVPQVLDDLTHLIGRELPSVPISDQGLRRFRLERKHSSAARSNRQPFSELLRMEQFLKHSSPGRVRWQEDRVPVESQPTCSSCLEIPLGIHALIHHTASGPEVGSDGVNFGLSQTCSPIPTRHHPSGLWSSPGRRCCCRSFRLDTLKDRPCLDRADDHYTVVDALSKGIAGLFQSTSVSQPPIRRRLLRVGQRKRGRGQRKGSGTKDQNRLLTQCLLSLG